jgi:hypothetical protein
LGSFIFKCHAERRKYDGLRERRVGGTVLTEKGVHGNISLSFYYTVSPVAQIIRHTMQFGYTKITYGSREGR